jgi:hypothetical protein
MVRTTHQILVAALVALLLGCATPSETVRRLAGTYRFEAWSEQQVFLGSLELSRSDVALDCLLSFEPLGLMHTLRCDLSGTTLTVVAEGPARIVRIIASVAGSEITGTWSSGQTAGLFRARRDSW